MKYNKITEAHEVRIIKLTISFYNQMRDLYLKEHLNPQEAFTIAKWVTEYWNNKIGNESK